MKKYFFILVVCLLLFACKDNQPKPQPDRFKIGNFEIAAGEGYAKTIIIRQDSIQIEKYENSIDTLSISWKNNFNYTLKMLHPKSVMDEEPIHVKITSIKENTYDFEAVIGHSNYIQKGTVTKISN